MNYDGGKNGSGVFQRLICMMPPHRVFIEPFLGSGAITRRKRPAEFTLGYELNRKTIAEFANHVPAEHFEAWTINAEWKAPNGDMPGNGGKSIGFNEPGTMRTNLEILNVDGFEALRHKFVAGSYFYALYDPAEVLIYLDPPYPDAVRSTKGKIYEFEMLTEQEHAEFCSLVVAIPARVMVSGYDNELYNDMLKGWRKEQIPTSNRAGQKVIETVWLNFPEPVELHDYKHAGDDYRDRWRITKRLRNWTGQLKEMTPAERGAMLAQLSDAMEDFNQEGRERLSKDDARRLRLATKAAAKFKSRELTTPDPASTPADLFE